MATPIFSIRPATMHFFLNLPLNMHLNLHLIPGCTKARGFCAWKPSGPGVLECESVFWAVPPVSVSVTGRKWVCKWASVDDDLKSSCCSPWKGSTLSPACKELWDLAIKPPFKNLLFQNHLCWSGARKHHQKQHIKALLWRREHCGQAEMSLVLC